MNRTYKVLVIATVIIVAFIGAIAVADGFRDNGPVVRAEVTEVTPDNALVLDIGMDELEGIGAEIGDDILVKTENDAFSAILAPSSKYKGIPIYGGYMADVSGKVTLGFTGCNHVTFDIAVGDILTLTREGRNPIVDRIPNYTRGYNYNPEDYSDMADFANFREVSGGDLIPGTIYRSASPWNDGIRSPFADSYHREQGTEFMICLNMDEEMMAEYADKMPDAYASGLYREDKVTGRVLHAAVHSYPDEFRFVIESLLDAEGKIGIFCTHGKDRTGFHCAVIEGLAGATYEEILADFMVSICNFHLIEEGSEEYELVAKYYPQRVLYLFDHTELISHPEKVDWDDVEFVKFDPEKVFTRYLVEYVGIDEGTVQKVKEKLTGGI